MIKIKKDERVSYYTHFIGFLLAILGTFILLYVSDKNYKIIISIIYGTSVISLFLSSSLYHAFKKRENEISFWRKLDHFAIFIMIAGSYTPVCYFYLSGYWRWIVIIIQWSLVFCGFFFKFYYLKAPRYLYTIIYLIMGWSGIIPIKQFLQTMPFNSIMFLFMGGLSFTIGAVFYMIKKPKIKYFGFHEIFHLFILLGGFFHYLLVYNAIIAN